MPPQRHGSHPGPTEKTLCVSYLLTFCDAWHRRCCSSAGPMRQHTIKKRVTLEGVGLHSGKQAKVTLSPAPEHTGIVFRAGDDRITAAPESVVNSHYATTIGKNGTRVATVEHLLAAAAGLGIDNLEVGVEGPEIPAMDGSAKPFVALLAAAGRNQQSARRRSLTLPNAIRVGSDGRWIHIFPAPAFRISYTLDVDHPAIGLARRPVGAALSVLPRVPAPGLAAI